MRWKWKLKNGNFHPHLCNDHIANLRLKHIRAQVEDIAEINVNRDNVKMCLFISLNYAVNEANLTRLNKIGIQDKGPHGKWTRKQLAYRESNIFHLCVTRPPETCVNLVLNSFTLLVVTHSVDNVFHSCIFLCKNEYFLISNLH